MANEVLELIYNQIPSAKDRVALASTSHQMRNVSNKYETVEHIILKPSDIDVAIEHRATRVTFWNGNLMRELERMPRIKYLNINNLKVTQLFTLPPKLVFLSCIGNALTSLPELPPTLKELRCGRNELTVLPTLPPTLKLLNCDENKLTQLPTLPSTLISLDCWHNQLTELPSLPPKLEILHCSHNRLRQLPPLPKSLVELVSYRNYLNLPSNFKSLHPHLKIAYTD